MNSETEMVYELWEVIKDHIHTSKKTDTMIHIFKVLENHEIDIKYIDLVGECEYMDEAIHAIENDEYEHDEEEE